jgi:hypothetical protein
MWPTPATTLSAGLINVTLPRSIYLLVALALAQAIFVVFVGCSGNGGNRAFTLSLLNDVTTLAGLATVSGSDDGIGSVAKFNKPYDLVTDGRNLYVADTDNHTIRKIVISTREVTTLAGTPGVSGANDGAGTVAKFNKPIGIATDGTYIYVADTFNHAIRKIVISTGEVTTLAGTAGVAGSQDGFGSSAKFDFPASLISVGVSLYVVDSGNFTIRKIVTSTGKVTTFAGSPPPAPPAESTAGPLKYPSADGISANARFAMPVGITTDGSNLFVVDSNTSRIRIIDIYTEMVTTLVYANLGCAQGFCGLPAGGTLGDITTDGTNLYLTSSQSFILKVSISSGELSSIAGSNIYASGTSDGVGANARFFSPNGITTDGKSLFVADTNNNTIRRID